MSGTHLRGMVLLLVALLSCALLMADTSYKYRTPGEIKAQLGEIAKNNKDIAAYSSLTATPGGRDISLMRLGKGGGGRRAILVIANMEADCPIASEAAVKLCEKLTGEWKARLEKETWFVIPCGNPDGYANFFSRPLYNNFGNATPVNDDNDDATDEDAPDDLNKDSYITMMRQKHPEGTWMPVADNPVLMKEADKEKGEVGVYRLFPEGLDNDGDGEINEDGPGGINPGHNFPHAFRHYTKTDGVFPASEAESRAILRFAFDHPEIAMIIVFGRENTVMEPPPSNKKSESSQSKYKLPGWMAGQLGIDPEQEFAMPELIEMGREFTGNPNLDEDMIMRFLGAGAAVNPDQNDLPYWNGIVEEYKKFIEQAELDGKRLSSASFPAGSVAEWAYFQYGAPTFCMDFWTLPEPEKKAAEGVDTLALTPEKLEKMTNEEFLALGEEKIGEFLKSSGAPAQYTAAMVMSGVKGGMMDTKRMAKMMKSMKASEEAGGADPTDEALFAASPESFVTWTEYNHPTLGPVEIGGRIPYATVIPPGDKVEQLIDKQLPFVTNLADRLPDISIKDVVVTKQSAGVYKVEVWVVNDGFLPYPTYQGKRCQWPTNAIVTIDGKSIELLEGKKRVVLDLLPGSGGVEKTTWLVKGPDGGNINIKAFGSSIGEHARTVALKGGAK